MTRFRYWHDGLFRLSCAAYLLNRFLLKPHASNRFLHGYFNDTLLIPCALPLLLLLQRYLGLRLNDDPPTLGETGMHLFVWSVICEGIGPLWMKKTTADIWDVVAYAAGALLAYLWWQRKRFFPPVVAPGAS